MNRTGSTVKQQVVLVATAVGALGALLLLGADAAQSAAPAQRAAVTVADPTVGPLPLPGPTGVATPATEEWH
ncbi:hypothetical protein GCM10009665_10020 [Kitasatospora nipponensis]|uniref:Uncharacterized protein n=1 Tax=Kitasatospora nipponensis TaxID=258049 RepID=A0ABN1VSY5_9ACTN